MFHFKFSSALSLASATSIDHEIAIILTFLNSVYTVLYFFELGSRLFVFLHDLSRSGELFLFHGFAISMVFSLRDFRNLFFYDIF